LRIPIEGSGLGILHPEHVLNTPLDGDYLDAEYQLKAVENFVREEKNPQKHFEETQQRVQS
jgi:hypothetical protein